MRTFRIHTVGLAALATATLLCACTAPSPRVDAHFGESVTAAKVAESIDPTGQRANQSTAGIDGEAASAALRRYYKSFVTPPPPGNVFTIGVSSGGGTQSH